jgi:acetyl esterase/lipase
MPSYDLAPTVSIADITRQIAAATEKAATLVDGPIRLSGHSAGGHLVTRMVCRDSPLARRVRRRVDAVVSISGLHDLRPLLRTTMNAELGLDKTEAMAESAALQEPIDSIRLICWVGAGERPEFIRQSDLLANIWTGLGIETSVVHAPGRHHFDVIDDLADAQSGLVDTLLQQGAAGAGN